MPRSRWIVEISPNSSLTQRMMNPIRLARVGSCPLYSRNNPKTGCSHVFTIIYISTPTYLDYLVVFKANGLIYNTDQH